MQDLDKFKNEMNLSGKNVYVGHRYVPKIFGEWDNTQVSEPLSIVQYQGNSFTSRQYVPVGVDINNEAFWASTGNYNAQVEQYRQDVVTLGNDVTTLTNDVETNQSEITTLKSNVSDISTSVDELENNALTVNKKIIELENKTQHIVKIKNDVSVDDYTTIIQSEIDKAAKNTTIILPSGEVKTNVLTVEGKENLTIKGDNTTLIYNGFKEVEIQGANNSAMLKVRNSDNIKVSDLILKGKMFNGLSKDNLPTTPITDSEYVNREHIGVAIFYSQNVIVNNLEIYDVNIGVHLIQASDVILNNIDIADVVTGVNIYKSTYVNVFKVHVLDPRFKLWELPFYTDSYISDYIGAGGTGVLVDESTNVHVLNTVVERSGTNTFRTQHTSLNVLFENCVSIQARRHGFSVYGSNSEVKFLHCKTYKTADKTFWNGRDAENTFRRPHGYLNPVSFEFSNGSNNKIEMLSCLVDEITYAEKQNLINPSDTFNAVVPRRLLNSENTNSTLDINNCIFKGYSSSHSVEIKGEYNFNNNIVEAPINDLTIYTLYSKGENAHITNNKFIGGRSIVLEGKSNIVTGNHFANSYLYGVVIQMTDSIFTNNYIKNSGVTSDKIGIVFRDSHNTYCDNNIVYDDREGANNILYVINTGITNFNIGKVHGIGSVQEGVNEVPLSDFASYKFGKGAAITDSTATDINTIKNDFNNLLKNLRNANIIQSE